MIALPQLLIPRTFEHRFVLPEGGVFGEIQRLVFVVQIVQDGGTEAELDRQVGDGSGFAAFRRGWRRFPTGYTLGVGTRMWLLMLMVMIG